MAATIAGVVALCALALYVRHEVPRSNWLFSGHYALGFLDLHSRFKDVHKVLRGVNVYSRADHHQYFTYPPAALLVLWPLSWARFQVDVLVWTLLSEFALAGVIALSWRSWRRDDPWMIAAGSLLGALVSFVVFPVLSIHLALGQLGLFIALALAVDYLALRGRAKGVLAGIATAIKIYPVVFIIAWALRREWRAVATAIASAGATTLVAFALWPSLTRTFISRQVLSGRELSHFLNNAHYLASSSSPFTIFFRWPFHGGAAAHVVGWAASIVAVGVGLWASERLWRLGRSTSSFVMVMGASVLAGPVTWDHYYVFAPLLVFVVLENRDLRVLSVTAAGSMVLYAVPWQLARNESLSENSLSARAVFILLARNALSLATIATSLAALWSTRASRSAPENLSEPSNPRA